MTPPILVNDYEQRIPGAKVSHRKQNFLDPFISKRIRKTLVALTYIMRSNVSVPTVTLMSSCAAPSTSAQRI